MLSAFRNLFPLAKPSCAAVALGWALLPSAHSQVAAPAKLPAITQAAVPALIDEAVKYQLEDFRHTSWGLRYRVHRADDKEDSLRELVESANGNVARTLQRHGKPLTPEEDAAEQERLRGITAADMAKHRHSAETSDKFGVELMSAMPKAMIYTLTPGQPQLPQSTQPQVVLDFAPNPQYHPATTSQTLLSGIDGRVWIDADTHHLVRIEVTVVKNLNLMFGILARVYEGGTLTYEQHLVGGGHYGYSHIEINVRLRELMVKTVPYHSTLTTANMTYMPTAPSFKDAVNSLLAIQP
jgi:hypothetical protein